MTLARSKISSQGQTSVPDEIRRKLGLRPGSMLEWHEEGERVIVCRAGRHPSRAVPEAASKASNHRGAEGRDWALCESAPCARLTERGPAYRCRAALPLTAPG